MIKVLVFFNAESCKVMTVLEGISSNRQEYPNGEKTHLRIMSTGFPSLIGEHGIVYVATDRELTSQEIFDAARKYLQHFCYALCFTFNCMLTLFIRIEQKMS